MKLADTDIQVERSGVGAESSFAIKATGKAFRILSDGLYTDKPRAIIRELSCNAYDAHVAAGCADKAFEVHLPTLLEPHFHVKDFGIGLTHDQVMHLYTTYFESTKTDSDDFVGCLGLGSKSPFAYVDSFTVETSQGEPTIRQYTAFIAESGVPSIVQMGERPNPDGWRGLMVSMPVKGQDISKFVGKAAGVSLGVFNPTPVMTGEEMPSTYTMLFDHDQFVTRSEQGRWAIADSKCRVSDVAPCIVMGNVIYPLPEHILDRSSLTREVKRRLVLWADIGAVEVAASREGLSVDEGKSATYLLDRLQAVQNELKVQFEKELAHQPTPWEVWKFIQQSEKLVNFGNTNTVKWRGMNLPTTFSRLTHVRPSDQGFDVEVKRLRLHTATYSWVACAVSAFKDLGLDYVRGEYNGCHVRRIMFFRCSPDRTRGAVARIAKYLDDQGIKGWKTNPRRFGYSQGDDRYLPVFCIVADNDEFEVFRKSYGTFPFIDSDNLPDPPKVAAVPGTGTSVTASHRSTLAKAYKIYAEYDNKPVQDADIEGLLKRNFLYVHTYRGQIVLPSSGGTETHYSPNEFRGILKDLIKLGVTLPNPMTSTTEPTHVIGVPASHKNLTNKFEHAKLFSEYATKALANVIKKEVAKPGPTRAAGDWQAFLQSRCGEVAQWVTKLGVPAHMGSASITAMWVLAKQFPSDMATLAKQADREGTLVALLNHFPNLSYQRGGVSTREHWESMVEDILKEFPILYYLLDRAWSFDKPAQPKEVLVEQVITALINQRHSTTTNP